MRWTSIENLGGIAVVTGGASGVGLAAAKHLASCGFEICLTDVNEDALGSAAEDLRGSGAAVHEVCVDVADSAAMTALADQVFAKGEVAVLMNNAGVGLASSTLENIDVWRKTFDVNFYGVLNGIQAFVPKMVEAGRPAAIINTGSKQGITTPPGNPAYNASKAALKVLTEQLAHELRENSAPLDVHLFVPGFTYTGMISSFIPEKPEGAWTSEETVAYLFEKVAAGSFYVLCPDNMVDEQTDAARVLWSANDIVRDRPALSRWHPDWQDAFSSYEKS